MTPAPICVRMTKGHVRLAAEHVAQLGALIENLVHAAAEEVDEHQLGNRAQTSRSRADRCADEPGFGNGGVEHAVAAEFLHQSLGDAHRATPGVLIDQVVDGRAAGDVFSEEDDIRVLAHCNPERFVDGALHRHRAGFLGNSHHGLDLLRHLLVNESLSRNRCGSGSGVPVLVRYVDVREGILHGGPRRSFGIGPGLVERLRDRLVDGVEFIRCREIVIDQVGPQARDRISVAVFRYLIVGAVGDRVTLEMPIEAIGLGFDQRRTLARRAGSIAAPAASYTEKRSRPSTTMPGMSYDAARLAISPTEQW